MDLSSINPLLLIATMIAASMPIFFAAIGELVAEKSGVLNLGVEGMMIIGAVCGFVAAVETGSPIAGVFAAMLAGAALSLLFGLLTQLLHANQVATGLALTLFGLGLSALIGQSYAGIKPPSFPQIGFGTLSELPVIGALLFGYDALVYASAVLVVAVWWFLGRSRGGLALRAVGENQDAAHALGYRVVAIRMGAIVFGGACAGVGGAYLSLLRVPQWTEGATAGAGWIALALVVFSSWKPFRVVLGAFLFGGVTLLQLNLQAVGAEINPVYLSMAPYLVTIAALAAISGTGRGAHLGAPGSLGKPFHASG